MKNINAGYKITFITKFIYIFLKNEGFQYGL